METRKEKIKGILKAGKPKAEKEQPREAVPVEDPFNTIKFVLMTEKSIQLIESQNKMVFIVNRKSSKDEIKKAFENIFSADVKEIKTVIDQKNRKKAFIKLKKEGEAGEIAIRLGII